jgi:hypothetical protein
METRDRVETACIAVTLVGRERELTPRDREPLVGVSFDLDDKPDRPRITRRRSCCFLAPELRLEPPAQKANRAYETFPRRRSAR